MAPVLGMPVTAMSWFGWWQTRKDSLAPNNPPRGAGWPDRVSKPTGALRLYGVCSFVEPGPSGL